MTSSSTSVFPATSRAGSSDFASDSGAAQGPARSGLADPSAADRRFDEVYLEKQRTSRSRADTSGRDSDPAARAAPKEPEADAADDLADEDELHARRRRATVEAVPQLVAALHHAAAPVAVAMMATPAENAATAESPSSQAPARQAAPHHAPAPQAAAARPGHRAATQPGPGGETSTTGSRAAAPAATTAPATPAGAPAHPAAARSATPAETPAAATPGAANLRQTASKAHAEKSAAPASSPTESRISSGENKFVTSGNQEVAARSSRTGTRAALQGGTMNTATPHASRLPVSLAAATDAALAGPGTWSEGLSVDWKGWTNGGGEHASPAAPISPGADKPAHPALAAVAAGAPVARATASAAQPAQALPQSGTVPVTTPEALAPIHSAIERLVLHGREQIALTVRFEQGGSLSIKLAMNNGAIATQIQTDVPGLEAALKASWGDLAQDWNNRGWKLAQPEFTGSSHAYQKHGDAPADGRGSGRHAARDEDASSAFAGRAFTPPRLKHTAAVATLSGLDALRAAARARRGIHTWA